MNTHTSTPTHTTPFVVSKNTPIGFGKLKGKPHEVLLQPIWSSYSKWIFDQGPDFRYKNTRDWLITQLSLE